MSYLADAKRLYTEGGFRKLLTGLGFLILKDGPTAPVAKQIMGATLHQKSLAYLGLGYWPQIEDPRTFNEKVLHRKLRTNDERFAIVEGKMSVRSYVVDRIGEKILPELLFVSDDPDEIPFDSLPDSYVIKPTHMAEEVIFVDSDDNLDEMSIRDQCRDWLSTDYGHILNHYWNSDIDREIMIEERLPSSEYPVPLDYKMYVFHGRVEYVHVDFDRFDDPSRRFFDRNWNALEIQKGNKPLGPVIDEPEHFEEMIEIAEALGAEFDFMRVDLYDIDDRGVVFGEMTTCPASGITPFYPQEYDFEFGALARISSRGNTII